MNQEKNADAQIALVYLYTYWDERSQRQETSTRFATHEAIRLGLGQPVPSSARKVLQRDLTDGVFYVPPPDEFLEHNPMATSKETA